MEPARTINPSMERPGVTIGERLLAAARAAAAMHLAAATEQMLLDLRLGPAPDLDDALPVGGGAR